MCNYGDRLCDVGVGVCVQEVLLAGLQQEHKQTKSLCSQLEEKLEQKYVSQCLSLLGHVISQWIFLRLISCQYLVSMRYFQLELFSLWNLCMLEIRI